MSRWLYQMSKDGWASENFRRQVREGVSQRWGTRRRLFAHEAPQPGDIIVCFYSPKGCARPGICGLGIVTKYLPKTRKIDWLPLPPTDKLKKNPWWDERTKEIVDLIRAQAPRGTMYQLPAVLDTDLRRGLFDWAARSK